MAVFIDLLGELVSCGNRLLSLKFCVDTRRDACVLGGLPSTLLWGGRHREIPPRQAGSICLGSDLFAIDHCRLFLEGFYEEQ